MTKTMVVGSCGVAVGVGLGVVAHMALLFSFQKMVSDVRLILPHYQFPVSALLLTVGVFLTLFMVLALAVPSLLLQPWLPLRSWLRRSSAGKGNVPCTTTYRYAWLSLLSLGTTVGISLFLPLSWLPDHEDAEEFLWTGVLFVICAILSFLGIYSFYRQGMMVVA